MEPKHPSSASGRIVTFYSYKGGTGRSMLLANVAWILATNGNRVLMIDWDLEAPGLHRYFHPFLQDKSMSTTDGLIDALVEFVSAAVSTVQETLADEEGARSHSDERRDIRKAPAEDLNWYKAYADLNRFAVPIKWEFQANGRLDLIGAGRQGSSYGSKVNLFDWQQFYDHFAGSSFLDAACASIREKYDYILIDSRTGVSDTSGICTIQLPDTLVVCFTLNNQSIEGAHAVTSAAFENRQISHGGKPLVIFPVPTRVEQNESDRVELGRELARLRFRPFVPHPADFDASAIERALQLYWGSVEVPYVPKYAYEEVLACFSDIPHLKSSVLTATEQLTCLICGKPTELVAPSDEDRALVLKQFARKPPVVTTAEDFFQALSPTDQELAHSVFIRTVQPSPTKGGNASDLPSSCTRSDFPPSGSLIVDRALEAKLLTTSMADGKQAIVLADSRLITAWQRLADWIDHDRDFLVWLQQLRQLRSTWIAKRDPDDLLTGTILTTASGWLAQRREGLTPQEILFIEESKTADERVREEVAKNYKDVAVGRRLQSVQWEIDQQEIGEKSRELEAIHSKLESTTKHRNLLVWISSAFGLILIGLTVIWFFKSETSSNVQLTPRPDLTVGDKNEADNNDRIEAEIRRQQANILVTLGVSTYNAATNLNPVEGIEKIDEKISSTKDPNDLVTLQAGRLNYIRNSAPLITTSSAWAKYVCAHNSFVIAASGTAEQAAKDLKRWKSRYPLAEIGVGTSNNPNVPIIVDFFLTCDDALHSAESIRQKYGPRYGWTPTMGWYNDLPDCSPCPFRPMNATPSVRNTLPLATTREK